MWSISAYVTVLGQATSSRIACEVRYISRRVLNPITLKFKRFLDYETKRAEDKQPRVVIFTWSCCAT